MSEHIASQDGEYGSDSDYHPHDSDSDCELLADFLELPPGGKYYKPIVLTSQSDLTHLTGQKHSA